MLVLEMVLVIALGVAAGLAIGFKSAHAFATTRR